MESIVGEQGTSQCRWHAGGTVNDFLYLFFAYGRFFLAQPLKACVVDDI